MSKTTPTPQSASKNQLKGYRWFSPKRIGVTAALLLLAAGVSFDVWHSRHAVWAIQRVDGVAFTADHFDNSPKTRLEIEVPEIVRSTWQSSELKFNSWWMTDDTVLGINLINSRADHQLLSQFGSLTSLRSLSLHRRQVGSELEALSGSLKLHIVKLFDVDSQTPVENLLRLPQLEQLSLVNSLAIPATFAELSQHPALRQLELVSLKPDLAPLGRLLDGCHGWSNLREMTIRSQDPLMPGLDALQTCPALKVLNISAPLTHDDIHSLSRIEQLTELILNVKQLAEEDLLMLANLHKLRVLKVYTKPDAILPWDELRRQLPQCEIEESP